MILSLDKTWTECIKMWRWIIKQHKKGASRIEILKQEYLRKHYPNKKISSDCFFCNYDSGGGCFHCPGVLVETSFNCENEETNWYSKPEAFLAKLLRLNAKRKRQRRKAKPGCH